MTTEEYESIVLVLGTSGQRVQLSPEATALVWNAVKSGAASSPEEYILRALDRSLGKPNHKSETSPSACASDQASAGQSHAPPETVCSTKDVA